jgi:hypothetical protein
MMMSVKRVKKRRATTNKHKYYGEFDPGSG